MRSRGRLTWWAAFAVFGAIGATWALSIAPMGAPDEIAHSRRAVAVARGQFTTEVRWLETPSLRAPQTEVVIPAGYAQGFAIGNELTNCWVNDLRTPTSCAPRPDATAGPPKRNFTYVGSYQPAYYLLVGLPSRWLPPSTGWYAMRVVSALLVAALLASAAVSVGELAARPWVVVGAAAGVTPSVLFLSGSINPNGLEIAAALAVWTALLALLAGRGAPPDRLLARLVVAAVALACTRPTSPLLLVIIVVVALAFGASAARLRELWGQSRVRVAVGVVGGALVANLAFVVANESLGNVIHTNVAARSTGELARLGVELTPGWLDEALGSLSWLGFGAVQLPVWTRWLWWSVIVAVLGVGLVRATNRQRAVVVLLAAACLVGPVAATVLEPAVQWQGRYALPLLMGIPLLAGVAAGAGPTSVRGAQRERWAASVLLAVLAACQVAAHQQLMVRNLLGLPSRLLRGILHAPWGGPLSPLALLAMAGAGSLGFLALTLAGVWRPVAPVAPVDPAAPADPPVTAG